MSVGDTEDIKKTANISNKSKLKLKKGDLVCCYLFNTSDGLTLLQTGVVVGVNEILGDVLVVDQDGWKRWWPGKRWIKCEKK